MHFNFHYTFNLTKLFWPPHLLLKTFWSPPFGNSKLFWPPLHFAQPPPPRYLWTLPKRCSFSRSFTPCFPSLLSSWKWLKITTCIHIIRIAETCTYICYALGRIRARTWVIELSCHWTFGTDYGDVENFINLFLRLKLLVDYHDNYTK